MLVFQSCDWKKKKEQIVQSHWFDNKIQYTSRVKNTAMRRGLMGTPLEGLVPAFQSQNGIVFFKDEEHLLEALGMLDTADMIVIAGTINDTILHHKQLAGLVQYKQPAQVYGSLAQVIKAPSNSLIRTLDSPSRSLIMTLDFHAKKLQAETEIPAATEAAAATE